MPEVKPTTNGWSKWEKHILISIDELKKQHCESELKIDQNRDKFIDAVNALSITIIEEVGDLRSDIKIMKTRITQRSAIWGVVAGSFPALIALIITLIKLA